MELASVIHERLTSKIVDFFALIGISAVSFYAFWLAINVEGDQAQFWHRLGLLLPFLLVFLGWVSVKDGLFIYRSIKLDDAHLYLMDRWPSKQVPRKDIRSLDLDGESSVLTISLKSGESVKIGLKRWPSGGQKIVDGLMELQL